MRLLPYGDRGLLVEVPDTPAVVALTASLRADPAVAEVVLDVVPGARTVLLVARPGVALDRLRAVVPDASVVPEADPRPIRQVRHEQEPELVVPVSYDGPDLAEVAQRTGLTPEEVVAAHTATPWRVAFGGFAPGFAYLVGGDPRLRVPRRAQPRTTVPAGSVGLAGEFCGIYPRASPGGWQLLGRTDLVLWDLERDPPAQLTAGLAVRFEAR